MSASSFKLAGATTLLALGLAACGDSNSPNTGGTVAFQLATKRASAPVVRGGASLVGSETIALGNDTIVLSGVQVVLRKIELSKVGVTACDSTGGDDHDCSELKAGPVLLDLPLGAGATRSFSVAVDTGSYSKLEFKIHKPSSSDDASFVAAHPDFDGVSIMVTGTYNGTAFTYTTDLDAEQETEFNPPLTVTDSTGASLTLFVDLATWFANAGNTGLVDPESALKGQPNEGLVKDHIEASLKSFEDEDHDGGDDHGNDS